MSYTPNNIYVFNQAFAGAVAGLLGQSTPLSTTSGAYIATETYALLWAEAVDTAWDSSNNPDQFENAEIFAFSNDLFEIYEPQPNPTVAMFTPTANALMTVLADGETLLGRQGITPGPIQGNNLNFNSMINAVAIHSQTQSSAGTLVALAAVAVQVQKTGYFQYDVDVAFSDGTTAKTVELRSVLYTGSAAAAAFTQSAGNVNHTNSSVGPQYAANTVTTLVAQLNQDSTGLTADGLLYGGVAPVDTAAGAQILWDQEVPTLTGLLADGNNGFHSHGTAGYQGDGQPTFTAGHWVVLVLELVSTAGGDVITFGSCTMTLREVA